MSQLPISETVAIQSVDELATLIREHIETGVPIYPTGGGTSLDFGVSVNRPGCGADLRGLNQIIEFPARDMTVTVDAGITMATLNAALGEEGLRLPIEVPHAAQATIGGVIATNTNGSNRYGLGTIRDYVIGISAIDGTGTLFHGGGKVVKNVAGYDFCKLLTGSLGTLAVINRVTLKLKPLVAERAIVSAVFDNRQDVERMLSALSESRTTPCGIDLLYGHHWADLLAGKRYGIVVYLEGTTLEVDWMIAELQREWTEHAVNSMSVHRNDACDAIRSRLIEFPAIDGSLVLKACLLPSRVPKFVEKLHVEGARTSAQSHAGNGIVYILLDQLEDEQVVPVIAEHLRLLAVSFEGRLTVQGNRSGVPLNQRTVFGEDEDARRLMSRVKQQFDPHNILNTGRFVYNEEALCSV